MFTEVLTGPSTFQSLPPTNLKTCSKRDIQEYFLNSYSLYESLFLGLKDETVFLARPDRLRLPLIFYYGHTASVYINKLVLAGLIKPEEGVNQHLETLLETGVDENSWDDTENYRMGGKFTWPRLSEVVNYRRNVKAAILKVIEDTPLKLPITKDSPWLTWLPQEVERSDFILVTNLNKYNNEKVRMTELVLPEGLLAIIYTESWRPNDLMELYKDRFTLVQQENLLNATSRDSPVTLTLWRHV